MSDPVAHPIPRVRRTHYRTVVIIGVSSSGLALGTWGVWSRLRDIQTLEVNRFPWELLVPFAVAVGAGAMAIASWARSNRSDAMWMLCGFLSFASLYLTHRDWPRLPIGDVGRSLDTVLNPVFVISLAFLLRFTALFPTRLKASDVGDASAHLFMWPVKTLQKSRRASRT